MGIQVAIHGVQLMQAPRRQPRSTKKRGFWASLFQGLNWSHHVLIEDPEPVQPSASVASTPSVKQDLGFWFGSVQVKQAQADAPQAASPRKFYDFMTAHEQQKVKRIFQQNQIVSKTTPSQPLSLDAYRHFTAAQKKAI